MARDKDMKKRSAAGMDESRGKSAHGAAAGKAGRNVGGRDGGTRKKAVAGDDRKGRNEMAGDGRKWKKAADGSDKAWKKAVSGDGKKAGNRPAGDGETRKKAADGDRKTWKKEEYGSGVKSAKRGETGEWKRENSGRGYAGKTTGKDGEQRQDNRKNESGYAERYKGAGEKQRGAFSKGASARKDGGAFSAKGKKSLCPVSRQCGGCQMLDMKYEKQLEWKQNYLEEQLKGLCPIKGMIGMKNPYHYRNKVHAVFDHDRRGNIISGIYQENTHIVVPVEKCLIEDQKADEIIGTIRGMLKSFKIRTYDEDTGFGLLRHVLVRRGFATGEIMVVLVTASPVFPSKNNFVKALRDKHPEITTIIQNINNRGTSMVLGDKEHVLYGKGYIEDILCGCRFRISSKSFYQVNPVQTEILYSKALELAGLTGQETVLDAYCGIGTIGLIASKKAGSVIGVELNKDAVKDAISNAKINGIENVKFYCNDAGRFLVNMAEKGEKVDVVIMDPPRSGSTEEFMESVAKMGVEKVVYVSCNAETLGRDLKVMKMLGYRAREGWGVDMFAGTRHVETAVLLVRKP